MSGLDKCPECGHGAHAVFGRDIREPALRAKMWRAECASQDLCAADTFTRFTREEAGESWNAYVRSKTAND
jgi:hypothetical protein